MPITLANMAKDTAKVSFSYGKESITVAYYPSRITEKTFTQLQDFSNTNASSFLEGFASLNGLLTHLVASWDVFEDEAQMQMFPLQTERLAELPIAFRLQVISAVMKDIRPGELPALQG